MFHSNVLNYQRVSDLLKVQDHCLTGNWGTQHGSKGFQQRFGQRITFHRRCFLAQTQKCWEVWNDGTTLKPEIATKRSDVYLVGGFNPSEKYESQTGSSSQLLGKIKAMFQTTNQLLIWTDLYWFGWCLLNPDISQQKRCSLCRKSSRLLHTVVLANHSRCWDMCLRAELPSLVWKDYKMLKDMPPCTISFWDIRGQRLPRY